LNLHIGRHNGVKPYKCTFPGCEFSFFDQYKLKNHLDVHTGKRIYKCGECEKCFRITTGLKSHHAAVHAKERKYKYHCGKSFSQKQYLQFHRTQHPELNLKRFICDVCSKKFSEPSSLRERKRRFHTGETSFQCDKCDYTACFKSRMDKHLLTHSNPQFDCTTCGKQFRQANNLKRHLATVHTAKNT
jgi:KRAB domain-containing zinc finger protein